MIIESWVGALILLVLAGIGGDQLFDLATGWIFRFGVARGAMDEN